MNLETINLHYGVNGDRDPIVRDTACIGEIVCREILFHIANRLNTLTTQKLSSVFYRWKSQHFQLQDFFT